MNALTGQQVAIVSPEAGTTTDPVNRAMELHPLGPCLIIDTAGFDDEGPVGELRNERTRRVLAQADMALVVIDGTADLSLETQWVKNLLRREVPFLVVLNKADLLADVNAAVSKAQAELNAPVVAVSAREASGMDTLREAMAAVVGDEATVSLTGDLAHRGDTVLLVMPQDPQSPKGRLILPQVQTIRDLLDKDCTVVCCTAAGLENALASLKAAPQLIITDSQVFPKVNARKPEGARLTSFSVLMAALKGDLEVLSRGAKAIDRLTPQSRVLIAEACTHAPLAEDIGREKIPRMLRQRIGQGLTVDIVAGKDFPEDVTSYDLVIHCGGCMFNRKFMLSRVEQCRRQGTPMTNYGITIAYIKGILDKVSLP